MPSEVHVTHSIKKRSLSALLALSISLYGVNVANAEETHEITYPDLVTAESVLDPELEEAFFDVDVKYRMVGPAPRALPAVAAAAVAVVGWCVKGALTSVSASAIQDAASRATDEAVAPPDYMMNAIFGCAGGPLVGALTTQAMRVKFAGAVLAFVIKTRNFV